VSRDRFEIRALRVVATHGVLAHERERPQPFELDLDLYLDTTAAGVSDRLEDTLDYGEVVTRAAQVVRDRSFLLLEALAETVASALIDMDPRVSRVAVTVRKLRPPVAEDLGSIGVRVERDRTEGAPER
jgi:dihydroneopterin aldolase